MGSKKGGGDQMSTNLRFLLLFMFIHLVILSNGISGAKDDDTRKKKHQLDFSLGVILDYSSRAGKEQKVAIAMAVEDFYPRADPQPVLHMKNSHGDPVRTASFAKTLIKKHNAKVILGLGTWQEASSVAGVANKSRVPILSFAHDAPSWAFSSWPFLVNAARSQFAQMKAIAAIVRSWEWRKVNVIYEDVNSAANGIIPHLINALQDLNLDINDLVPLPPLPKYNSSSEKLSNLKNGQSRVFIVHTSMSLARNVFKEAKKLGMMEKEFVWITTNSISDVIDTLNPSTIRTMQGVLGLQTHFSHSGKRLKSFWSRFRLKFRRQYPEEPYPEPGIYARQAYDAVRAIALATKESSHREYSPHSTDDIGSRVSNSGDLLLNRILESNFDGLTGEFNFKQGIMSPGCVYCIINVVGRSYHKLGYWSDGLGFSKNVKKHSVYNYTIHGVLRQVVLRQVVWPGGPRSVPRGWAATSNKKPLRIGVPTGNCHREFVNVEYDRPDGKPNVTGFSIDVFQRVIDCLPYDLPYDFKPFEGTYDSLVEELHHEKFDAVVGDTATVANRSKYAEFSLRYADSGLQMVVYEKPRSSITWSFAKPFTTFMWATTGAVVLYNGFVVWFIERKHNPEFTRGTKLNQFGTLVSLSFTTLFSQQGEKLHSNLSRMTMIVFLFVTLVVTQSYTASLTALLTVQRLDPRVPDIEKLKRTEAKVGCDENSFVIKYLEVVLGFKPKNIIPISSEEEYPQALITGKISAAFLEVPYVKVFLAKNCKRFVQGPIFKVGGFGFVFPMRSPYLPDISRAILEVSENGILRQLEISLLNSYNCSTSDRDDDLDSLDLPNFSGLFLITVGTSTLCLILFMIHRALLKYRHWRSNAWVQPRLENFDVYERWILDVPKANENTQLHQPEGQHDYWLSGWEWENQGCRSR